MKPVFVVALTLSALMVPGAAAAAEKAIQRKDLPAAVEKTLARETEGATIKGITAEPCEGGPKGRTCYEAETIRAGVGRDLVIDSEGSVVEDERVVDVNDLPPAVRDAAMKMGGKILSAEKATKAGLVTYELQVERARKITEKRFLADGTSAK